MAELNYLGYSSLANFSWFTILCVINSRSSFFSDLYRHKVKRTKLMAHRRKEYSKNKNKPL
ncbi:MAG: hypothetical protein ACFCAD_03085, partial [Pleurocapsa sp.]